MRPGATRSPQKGKKMTHRVKLLASEIQDLCVAALKRCPGLRGIKYATIKPYRGEKSWTWELHEVGPDAGQLALDDAKIEIN